VSAAFTVLLVCTGNICRSALAERLGRAYLDEALAEDAAQVRIVSAGTRAVVGSEMHSDSALVLRGLGGEPGDFRARQFDGSMAADADVVLTMTREHRARVLEGAPRALARTFTLREAADLLGRLDGEAVEGSALDDRARNLVSLMAAARSKRQTRAEDDVCDPIGQPLEVHDEVGTLIAEALIPLLRRIVEFNVQEAVSAERR